MWLDWLVVLRNSNGNIGYALTNFGLFLLVLVAWLGRQTTGSAAPAAAG
jgi:hypothetical protein